MPTSATSDAAIWDAAETLPREQLRASSSGGCARPSTRVLRAAGRGAAAADAGVSAADDIGSLDDLARLPFTTKADLRDHYPFGLLAVPREELVRVHASSGTHGKPTVVGYTRADLDDVDRADGALHDDGRRAAGDADPQRQRLRAVHRRARLSPGRRADRRDGRPRVRRLHARARRCCCATSARRCSSRRPRTRS